MQLSPAATSQQETWKGNESIFQPLATSEDEEKEYSLPGFMWTGLQGYNHW